MMRHRGRKRAGGLTLIEVMVALAVFAVLGTLTYRGTAQLILARTQIEHELERWREIDRALQIVETELMQIVAPAITPGSTRTPSLQVQQSELSSELQILSLSQAAGVERVSFEFRDDSLAWVRRPEAQAAATPERDILLARVDAVRWRFLTPAGWNDRWPAPGGTTSPGTTTGSANSLPAAIEIVLDLPDIGRITRLHALR
ncbi:MAG: type II secretion system minor pseudopilin GspJ [Zoogloeaceae bacterium]|nr:type II secretion system minor pseudopilin GspJ [Zoogloeaceae bacterium]